MAAALASTAAQAAPAASEEADVPAPSLERVGLLVSGLNFDTLVQEFRLRAPQFEIIVFGSNPADENWPVVTVWILDESSAAATVELEDGRIYRREIVIDAEEPELGAASE